MSTVGYTGSAHGSLGHLVYDVVVQRGSSIRFTSAKYNAHLADLDEIGWHHFAEDCLQSHRPHPHQALAYASLSHDEEVTATLVNQWRLKTWGPCELAIVTGHARDSWTAIGT